MKVTTTAIPQTLLAGQAAQQLTADLVACEDGMLCGMEALAEKAHSLGLGMTCRHRSGERVLAGEVIATVHGSALQVIEGENHLLGVISKVSGLATAASRAVDLAGGVQIVCGGWKKVPAENKQAFRHAVELGGALSRIAPPPFLYLDKNYVRVFGSITATLEAAAPFEGYLTAIQVKGETCDIADEALQAVWGGADIIMVDTGSLEDLRRCATRLVSHRLRANVRLAFAGGLTVEDVPALCGEDIDFLDIGRAILDARLLDIRYDIRR